MIRGLAKSNILMICKGSSLKKSSENLGNAQIGLTPPSSKFRHLGAFYQPQEPTSGHFSGPAWLAQWQTVQEDNGTDSLKKLFKNGNNIF